MTNPLDATPDYKSAWQRLKTEMEWCAKTGYSQFPEYHARALLTRMEQIEAFETVTEMLKVCPVEVEVTRSVDPEAEPLK